MRTSAGRQRVQAGEYKYGRVSKIIAYTVERQYRIHVRSDANEDQVNDGRAERGGDAGRRRLRREQARPLELEAVEPAHVQQLRDGRLAARARVVRLGARRGRRAAGRRGQPGDLLFLGDDEALGGHLALADDARVREEAPRGLDVLPDVLVPAEGVSMR